MVRMPSLATRGTKFLPGAGLERLATQFALARLGRAHRTICGFRLALIEPEFLLALSASRGPGLRQIFQAFFLCLRINKRRSLEPCPGMTPGRFLAAYESG